MKRMLVIAGALLLSVGAGIAQQDVVKQTQADMKGNGKALGGVLMDEWTVVRVSGDALAMLAKGP